MSEIHRLELYADGRLYLPKDTIDRVIGMQDFFFPATHHEIYDLHMITFLNVENYERIRKKLIRIADEEGIDPAEYLRWLSIKDEACISLDKKGYYVRLCRTPALIRQRKGPGKLIKGKRWFDWDIIGTEDVMSLFGLPQGGPVTAFAEQDRIYVVKRADESSYEKVKNAQRDDKESDIATA